LGSSPGGSRGGKSGLSPPPIADEEAGKSVGKEAVDPAFDGDRVVRPEEAVASDVSNGLTLGDFDKGGSPFAEVGFGMVVASLAKSDELGGL
jgi:hypothetical protein